MSKSLLLVGTRKGLFVLESDDRRDWTVRGPYCESWPVYNAALDPDSGTIYAAASSEWFGSAIWRSADLGETWEHSSEGLAYPEDDELKLSKVSHVMPAHGRLLVGAEAAGLFESTDGGKTFSLMTAEVHIPPVLAPLFPGMPRQLEVEAATVDEAIDRLNEQWPGVRDRLVEPGSALRPHINVYVDRERGGLDSTLEPDSRIDVIAAISGG